MKGRRENGNFFAMKHDNIYVDRLCYNISIVVYCVSVGNSLT